jgi:NADH dehydrogenase
MPINLPETKKPRVVIVGAGFAGLTLARHLSTRDYQVVLIDRNNFHQFQPLLYQVAMSGIEPSAIAFPLRKLFRRKHNFHVRVAEVESVHPGERFLQTNEGRVNYDLLVLSTGVTTNYRGNTEIEKNTYPLKSVADALFLRNAILSDLEKALMVREYDPRQELIDLVIVGGGPTGVELAGSMAEMKKYILPRDYAELDAKELDIYLIEGNVRLLSSFSEEASEKALKYVKKLGIQVILGCHVTAYDGQTISLNNGQKLVTRKVIWAAGITGVRIPGIPEEGYTKNNRLITDTFNQVKGMDGLYALGDGAYMEEGEYKGHPQVAQPALQQARRLAKNLNARAKGKPMKPFHYRNLGSMATIGRNKAVADFPFIKIQGFVAWVLWLVVHLKSILGVKNKLMVMMNWSWSYFTFDQNLRIIIKHRTR